MYFVSSVKIEISTSIVLDHNQADLRIILLCFGILRFERLLPMTYGKVLGKSFFLRGEKSIREGENLMLVFLLLRGEYDKDRARLLLPCVG